MAHGIVARAPWHGRIIASRADTLAVDARHHGAADAGPPAVETGVMNRP